MTPEEQKELLTLFRQAPGDFKNLLLGQYGKLPMGWPADWVYKSTFIKTGKRPSPTGKKSRPRSLDDEDLTEIRQQLADQLGRRPTQEEFILFLMPERRPDYFGFREIR